MFGPQIYGKSYPMTFDATIRRCKLAEARPSLTFVRCSFNFQFSGYNHFSWPCSNYCTVSGDFIISCWDVFRQFQSYKIAAIWTVWRSNAFLKVFAWVCLDIFRQNSLWRSWAVRTIEMGTTHSIKYQLRFRLRSINSILTFQVSILTFHVFDALNYGINKPKTLYTGICSSTLYESPSFIVVVLMDNSLDTGS